MGVYLVHVDSNKYACKESKRSHFISKTIKVLELELWNLEHIWGSGVLCGLLRLSCLIPHTELQILQGKFLLPVCGVLPEF